MIGLKNNLFENIDLHETSLTPTNSPQNLSPGRFGHAESELGPQNRQFRRPDLEI